MCVCVECGTVELHQCNFEKQLLYIILDLIYYKTTAQLSSTARHTREAI